MTLDHTKIICNYCGGCLKQSLNIKRLFICENKLSDNQYSILHSSIDDNSLYHNFEKNNLPYEVLHYYNENTITVFNLSKFLITNKEKDITEIQLKINNLNAYNLEEYKQLLSNLIFQ